MKMDDTLRAIERIWRERPQTDADANVRFAKFILDPFAGEGIAGLYMLTDEQVLKQLKAFYKQPNRSNPLKGGK